MTRSRLLICMVAMVVIAGLFVGCSPRQEREPEGPDENGNGRATRTVVVYFAAEEPRKSLQPVERTIDDGPDHLLRTAELLIAGPTSDERSRSMSATLPAATRVLSAVLSGDTLILDLSRELITAPDFPVSAEAESLALESIAYTFGQFPAVKAVRILVEGRQEGKIDNRQVADLWGHVGLPPTLRTQKPPAQADSCQTAGSPVDGLKLTNVRWSWGESRLRVVFDVANMDGSPATAIPFTRVEQSPDGSSILIYLSGMAGTDVQAPQPGRALAIASPVATSLEWLSDEAVGDDQMFPLALRIVEQRATGFQLFGLTEPVRVVVDVYGE